MTYGLLSDRNMTDAPEQILIYINDELMGFPSMMFLFMIFMIFMLGTYFINRKATGDGDIAVAMMVGSWVTLITAILLRIMGDGIVNNVTVAIVFGVALVSVLFLLFSRRE